MTPAIDHRGGTLVVVKLGGSLINDRERLVDLATAIVAAPGRPVIVPGGGIFADAVRGGQEALRFSDALAHRLALDAMGHFAEVLCELVPGLALATSSAAVAPAHAEGLVPVWTPAALRSGHTDIPESWDVTSDSLAAFLATEIGADALILVKSAMVPPQPADTLHLLDAAFPAFLAHCSGIVRVLGSDDHHRLGLAIADPAAAIGCRLN